MNKEDIHVEAEVLALDVSALAPYVMVDEVLTRLRGNKKLYLKLLESYSKSGTFQEMTEDISAGDLEKARASTHSLKGVAANLSLKQLYDQLVTLEKLIIGGHPIEEIQKSLAYVGETREETNIRIEKLAAYWSGGGGSE